MTAAFMRQKRLPSLQLVLNPKARIVTGEEKVRRQAEFDDLVRAMEG